MTHEELIERLQASQDNFSSLANALIAVANRHAWKKSDRGMHIKQRCPECGFAYPCPTVEDIQRALGGISYED